VVTSLNAKEAMKLKAAKENEQKQINEKN
jgi:hypothetical protein